MLTELVHCARTGTFACIVEHRDGARGAVLLTSDPSDLPASHDDLAELWLMGLAAETASVPRRAG